MHALFASDSLSRDCCVESDARVFLPNLPLLPAQLQPGL